MFNQLNPKQADAVKTIQGPILVLAGAGTGKTKVITSRIAWMISNGILPENIVAVSFTNKAANEMRERLSLMIGKSRSQKVFLSTFHSFALKLIREYSQEIGLQNNFTIADEGESLNILKESMKENALHDLISTTSAKEKISYYKDNLYQEADFKKSTNFFDSIFYKKLFLSYNRRLRLLNLVDFDDIVYLATLLLLNNPPILEENRNKYKYLLVDEYQDTSFAQFKFIELLAKPNENVCVVGDDDQSIYSWRGARPSIISDFLTEFPSAKKVILEQNYRCSPQILEIANLVIRENTERLGKELWSQNSNSKPVIIHSCEHERDEAEFILDKIMEIKQYDPEFSYSKIAVLFRSNSLSIPIEQIFQEKKIPFILHGGTKFFDKKEIKDLLSFIKFSNNNNDLNSLFRILNLASQKIDLSTLENIKLEFLSSQNLIAVLENFSINNAQIDQFLTQWKNYGYQLKSAKGIHQIISAIENCYEHLGLKKDILINSPNMQIAQYRLDTVERLLKLIQKIELENANLQDVIDAFHLDDAQFTPKIELDGKIQLMTIHASKGLEFPYVFLIGLEDGILPHERNLSSISGVQEERRLFYVALTRAKERLFITYCQGRKRNRNNNDDSKPSRFLNAISNIHAEFSEFNPLLELERKNNAAQKLFNLFK